MLRNLKKKAILIIAITLVSLYGVIGLPTGWDSLLNNLRDRTRLGLDLQGGTHLVLQVMVNEAINAESDQTVERLRQTLRQKDIDYAAITRIDATELMDDGGITIEGIPSEQTSAFRDMMEIQEI